MEITENELVDNSDDGIEDPPEPPPKRGRGRPRKGQEVNPPKERITITRTEQIEEVTANPKEPAKYTLPQPPGAKPQQLAIGVDPVNFFHWWYNKLSYPLEKKSFDWVKPPDDKPQTKPRYKAYWYRKFPKIDPGLVGNKNSYIHVTHNWPFTEEGKPIQDWTKGTLALFGTGRYKIELVDYYASRSIANCEFEVFDWAHNPPKLNMDMVVMESPENRVFIQQMRARNIKLPGDDGYKRYQGNEEDDEMATAATEVMSKMTDRLFDKLDKQDQPPAETTTAVAAMNQMGNLVRALVENRGDDGTKAALMELVRSLKDGGGNNGQQIASVTEAFKDMMDRLKEQHETSMLAMRDQLKDSKDEVKHLKQQVHDLQMKLMDLKTESNKDNLFEQIERVQHVRELLGVKGNGSVVRRPVEDEGDGMPKWLPMVLQMAAPILQQFATNMQQGQPGGLPGQGLQQQTPTGPAPLGAQAPQGLPPNQNTQPSTQPNPQPNSAPSGAEGVGPTIESIQLFGKDAAMALFNAYDMFLNMLAPAIVKHLLDPDLHGEDLAQAIIDYHGEPVYQQAASVDQDDLVAAIIANKTIWNQTKNYISREYLVEFAEHFKNAVKYWPPEDEEVGEELKEGEVKVVDSAKAGVIN